MFFSVKVPMKIGGKVFHTCVCYALTNTLKSTVEKLASEGKAVLYEEKQFFCNGRLLEKKTAKTTAIKPKKEKKAKAVEEVSEEVKDETIETEEIKEEDF